jgi:hypothetical protein
MPVSRMRRKEAAMIELTAEQRQELSEPNPVAIDPQTKQEYVLVRREVYERLRALLDEDGLDMRQVAALVERAMREDDENDPALALYQQKYGRKP